MTKHLICVAILTLAIGCTHSEMNHHHDEESERNGTPVSLEEIPESARQTLEREAKGAPLTDLERERKHGRTVYEAHATVDGKNIELHVSPSGKLLNKEIEKKDED